MSCPSWQWHRAGSRWSPVRTLPVAPLWCDLGFVPNSRGNKAAANLRPITACHFPRDNTQVEADFLIWTDYGPSKCNYHVHHPENTKDFFERVWDYQAKKIRNCNFLLHQFMFHNENLEGKRRSSPSSCCLAVPARNSFHLCRKPSETRATAA